MDRLYTSISKANWLLKNEITVLGTLVTNGIGLPDDLENAKQQGEFETSCIGGKPRVIFHCVRIQKNPNRKEKRTSWYCQPGDH